MNEGTGPGQDPGSDTQPMDTPAAPPPMPADPTPAPADAAPTAPAMAPPPIAPPSAPAAPVAWSAATPVVATRGGRTTLAAVAGVALIVLGVIGGLIGLAITIFGGLVGNLNLSQLQDQTGLTSSQAASFVGGVVIFIGIVVLVYSLFYIVGGIGVLRSREWGRVIGIVVGIISGLIWLAGLSGDRGSVIFALILFLIHAYVVVVLAVQWRNRAVVS